MERRRKDVGPRGRTGARARRRRCRSAGGGDRFGTRVITSRLEAIASRLEATVTTSKMPASFYI